MVLLRLPASAPRHAGATHLGNSAAQSNPCGFRTRHSHAFTARYAHILPILGSLECIHLLHFTNASGISKLNLSSILFHRSPAPWRRAPTHLTSPPSAESSSNPQQPSVGSGWMDMPETQVSDQGPVEVFPRLKERDPYKRLGIEREASFEEVQDARNFLYDQYSAHEPSRESIELAFDDILQEKMKVRHRFGFRPPTRGKYGEAKGDPLKQSIWQIIRSKFESSVPSTTLVNDGSIFVALGLWAAWQAASSDPTLPIGAALCFCAWKLYDKRNKRNPDGPYLGGSPIWGALGSTIVSLLLGALVSFALVQILPLPAKVTGEAAGLFFITISLGAGCIFLK